MSSNEKYEDFYQLRANLREVRHPDGSTEITLVFEKRVDPAYSTERLRELEGGFVVASIKKVGPYRP
ncbi:MAG: hypothetical protein AUJ07_10840 [Crenarchaeota archaeon 13_1_40CM_3_53_5]|nr:MAG: hypothetical protein AUJ07_10840 [Crenarchaeota archaeon 13_1_40CM_3_53_5]